MERENCKHFGKITPEKSRRILFNYRCLETNEYNIKLK